MSRFLSGLRVFCVDDTSNSGRGTWRLEAPLVFQSDVLGKNITVEEGFLTDFASVPRLPVIYFLFGDSSHKAAVVHDWLCQHHEVSGFYKTTRVLREAMEADGIPGWRRWGIYLGVLAFGYPAWKTDAPDPAEQPTKA